MSRGSHAFVPSRRVGSPGNIGAGSLKESLKRHRYWARCAAKRIEFLSKGSRRRAAPDHRNPGWLRFFCRHRDAGDLDLDGAEVVAAGEVEGLPVITAEGEVGRRRGPMGDP